MTFHLFDLLKPGGEIIIGNFSNTNPIGIKWVMEFICDWNLIYRSEEELMLFKSRIPTCRIENSEIFKDDTGINSFLRIKKR